MVWIPPERLISPGVTHPLRGPRETWAIRGGFPEATGHREMI